ncbi:hypothetical protein SuNHUV7_35210 (plasmid) [Pseudoseohaeicola sp. NH-UV-7]|uniref:hypothetical protein n=1 Tax=Sulfitobacter sp. TBRI5 TaxID=2989732 RepID=UPI003A6BD8BC
MKPYFTRLSAVLMLITAVFTTTLPAQADTDTPRGLFVNLTTDDTWAAAKGIMFANEKSLKNGHDTAIWLKVRAV